MPINYFCDVCGEETKRKYFCDVCGEETKRKYVLERLKQQLSHDRGKVECEVTIAMNGTWYGGVICEKCLRYALTQPEKGDGVASK